MPNLVNTEFEIHPFFEMTPDLVCIAGKDGFFKKVNKAVINKLGFSEQELFASPITAFMHPEDREMTTRERSKLLKGKALINFQNRYLTKKGKIIWLDWTSIYFADKEIVFAIAKDVTERKEVEKEIEEKYNKFKNLAAHFKSSIEKDRKYIADELHEELAQLATVVKFDIGWISNNINRPSAEVKRKIEHALAVSELLIESIRRISFSMSPKMMDDLGLNETLQWYCNEFSILNGITCEFESAYNENDLTQEIKTDFFRICQEALRNVIYHAQASKVKVRIEDINGKICLSITDDGVGFDPEQQKRSFGLTGMKERAASINGQLTIESETGGGTRIFLTTAPH